MCLFIKTNNFVNDLVKSLKDNNELVDEYIYNKGIHVVEIRPPINYSAFLEGEYSKIYTQEQLKKCFRHKPQPESDTLKILRKDIEYFPKYFKYIQKQFGNSVKESDVKEHKEYDLPPNLNQEIFSYD